MAPWQREFERELARPRYDEYGVGIARPLNGGNNNRGGLFGLDDFGAGNAGEQGRQRGQGRQGVAFGFNGGFPAHGLNGFDLAPPPMLLGQNQAQNQHRAGRQRAAAPFEVIDLTSPIASPARRGIGAEASVLFGDMMPYYDGFPDFGPGHGFGRHAA